MANCESQDNELGDELIPGVNDSPGIVGAGIRRIVAGNRVILVDTWSGYPLGNGGEGPKKHHDAK